MLSILTEKVGLSPAVEITKKAADYYQIKSILVCILNYYYEKLVQLHFKQIINHINSINWYKNI